MAYFKFVQTGHWGKEDILNILNGSNNCFSDHDPIVLRQMQREQFQRHFFGTNDKSRKLVPGDSIESQPWDSSESKDGNYSDKDDVFARRQLWRAQQIPNRIRRLRSRHGNRDDDKLWFVSSNKWSFNSRCVNSKRYDRSELDENSRQYYYFKSLPRIASTSLVSSSPLDVQPVSIFLGEHEEPGTPPAKRAAAERQKRREQMLL